jgi:succinyl-CoA synthetase alpha subunit
MTNKMVQTIEETVMKERETTVMGPQVPTKAEGNGHSKANMMDMGAIATETAKGSIGKVSRSWENA